MSRLYDPTGTFCDACLNREPCPRHYRMKHWPRWCLGGGSSYWIRGALSWNEGEFPNVHLRWGIAPFGFYIALAPGLRFSFFRAPRQADAG